MYDRGSFVPYLSLALFYTYWFHLAPINRIDTPNTPIDAALQWQMHSSFNQSIRVLNFSKRSIIN